MAPADPTGSTTPRRARTASGRPCTPPAQGSHVLRSCPGTQHLPRSLWTQSGWDGLEGIDLLWRRETSGGERLTLRLLALVVEAHSVGVDTVSYPASASWTAPLNSANPPWPAPLKDLVPTAEPETVFLKEVVRLPDEPALERLLVPQAQLRDDRRRLRLKVLIIHTVRIADRIHNRALPGVTVGPCAKTP